MAPSVARVWRDVREIQDIVARPAEGRVGTDFCRICRGGQCRLLEGSQKLGVPTAAEGFEGEVGQDFTERHCVGAGPPRVTMRPFGRDVVAVEAAMVV